MADSTNTGADRTARPATGTPPSQPLRDAAADTASAVREQASAAWRDTKDSTRSMLNERKDATAHGLHDVADALHDAAERSAGEADPVSRFTRATADGLEQLSNRLRDKDVSAMFSDMTRFARTQPMAFFGLALAAGFIGARLMKDTTDSHPTEAP